MDMKVTLLDAGLGAQVAQLLERGDKFWSAIGVAGIIHRIHADKNIARVQDLGPSQSQRQHHCIARGHIGDRDADRRRLWHGDSVIGQRRAAKLAQAQLHQAMFGDAQLRNDARGGGELCVMPLPIVEGQRITGIRLLARNRQYRGRIQPAG